jgi:membrane-bound lytic murein transglycosylase A
MMTDLPVIENGAVVGLKKTARLIFNHDRGGAIKGAGRVDLFTGRGSTAAEMAGNMKQRGSIFFLLKKDYPLSLAGKPEQAR